MAECTSSSSTDDGGNDANLPYDVSTTVDTGVMNDASITVDTGVIQDTGAMGDTSVARDTSVTGNGGGVVPGPVDMHCAGDGSPTAQMVNPLVCHSDAGRGDASAGDGGDMTPDYGETLFGSVGDDDDCKYHVTWSSTPISQNTDVTFTVTVTYKTNSMPVHMAAARAEVFLNTTHPAPNTMQMVQEQTSGTYKVGPIRFDASGRWTTRFHFFEDCEDSPDSPHGHAAFYVNVP